MTDPALLIAMVSTGTLAIALSAAAALRGWHGWLEIRRLEIAGGGAKRSSTPRLELADLRDRVRRLERIANGAPS